MNRLRAVLRRVVDVLLPWPSRHERRAAVAAATLEKERSQSAARHAAVIEQQILRIAEENHFALRIAEQLWQEHRRGAP